MAQHSLNHPRGTRRVVLPAATPLPAAQWLKKTGWRSWVRLQVWWRGGTGPRPPR